MPRLKLGNIQVIFSTFKKYLKDTNHNYPHLTLKYAWLYEAHSFPRAWLEENCLPLETDNVQRQISEHIFLSNGGYVVRPLIKKEAGVIELLCYVIWI